MSQTFVLCFDGTSQRRSGDSRTNVAILANAAAKDAHLTLAHLPNSSAECTKTNDSADGKSSNPDPHTASQVVWYHPGVGSVDTFRRSPPIVRDLERMMGVAFGYGIDRSLKDAYEFLVRHYDPGDRLLLFGFSRGAYAARGLAGWIHACGIVDRHHFGDDEIKLKKQCERSWRAFSDHHSLDAANAVRSDISHACEIDFLGVWDTVSSVGWVYSPRHYRFTAANPSVRSLRHAMAIDERRAFFNPNRWRTVDDETHQQHWFAGCHGDVGGHYRRRVKGSVPSRIPLAWVIKAALDHQLNLSDTDVKRLTRVTPPDIVAETHPSLKWYWWPLELWPKLVHVPPGQFSWFGRDEHGWGSRLRMNLGRHRHLAKGDELHWSVYQRATQKPTYRPPNILGKIRRALGMVHHRKEVKDGETDATAAGTC